MRSVRSDDSGFTLVELLVVIVLLGVIGGVVVTSTVRSLRITVIATERVEALTSLQRAEERMSRNIRAADPLSAAGDDQLTVDVYDSATVRRVVTYTLTADTLMQTVRTFNPATSATPISTSTTMVIDGLDQGGVAVFAYEDETGGPWDGVSPSDVRHVTITLRREIDDAAPMVLTTGVYLRNAALEPLA